MGDIDWNGDPELKKLRDGFLDSLMERVAKIQSLKLRNELRQEIHRLAGAAGSYDCLEVFKISAALDQWLADGAREIQDSDLKFCIGFLVRAMKLEHGRQSHADLMSSEDRVRFEKIVEMNEC